MRRGWSVCLLAVVANCATAYDRYEFERSLTSRASGDLACPSAQVRIAPLGDAMVEGTDVPVYERVEGCGRRADYIMGHGGYERITEQRDSGKEWVRAFEL